MKTPTRQPLLPALFLTLLLACGRVLADTYPTTFGIAAHTGDQISALDVVQAVQLAADPQVTYTFFAQGTIDSNFSFIDNSSTLRTALILDGSPVTSGRSVQLSGGELGRLRIQVGNELFSFAMFSPPQTPFGMGYMVRFNRGFYTDATPTRATPAEIVSAALAFADRYGGTVAHSGCLEIGSQIAIAAGAPLPYVNTGRSQAMIKRGAHWVAAYDATQGQVASWSTLLQPGDMVRYWHLNSSSDHLFTVISASDKLVDAVDNKGPGATITRHSKNYEDTDDVDPATVMIYRLNTSYGDDSDRVFSWAESAYPGLLNGSPASQSLAGYRVRLYASGWALGSKDGTLYGLAPGSADILNLGAIGDYLARANRSGF